MRRLIPLLALVACSSNDVNGMGSGADGGGGSDVDGDVLHDSGPDIDAPDAPPGFEDYAAVPAGCATGRSTSDRPDDSVLPQIKVMYVVPSDMTDKTYDTNGKICNSIRGVATWFHNATGLYLRWDTYGGLLDVQFVRLSKTDAYMRGNDPQNTNVTTGTAFVRNRIEIELNAMGLTSDNELYAVYYEGTSVYACGGGAYPPAIEERVGAMYLDAQLSGMGQSCGDTLPWGQASLKPNYVDYGIVHETVHSMGIVTKGSPNFVTANPGHVFDSARDLMYSPRPSTTDPGWATSDPNGLLVDLNHDDYFEADRADVVDQKCAAGVPSELSRMPLIAPMPANAVTICGW